MFNWLNRFFGKNNEKRRNTLHNQNVSTISELRADAQCPPQKHTTDAINQVQMISNSSISSQNAQLKNGSSIEVSKDTNEHQMLKNTGESSEYAEDKIQRNSSSFKAQPEETQKRQKQPPSNTPQATQSEPTDNDTTSVGYHAEGLMKENDQPSTNNPETPQAESMNKDDASVGKLTEGTQKEKEQPPSYTHEASKAELTDKDVASVGNQTEGFQRGNDQPSTNILETPQAKSIKKDDASVGNLTEGIQKGKELPPSNIPNAPHAEPTDKDVASVGNVTDETKGEREQRPTSIAETPKTGSTNIDDAIGDDVDVESLRNTTRCDWNIASIRAMIDLRTESAKQRVNDYLQKHNGIFDDLRFALMEKHNSIVVIKDADALPDDIWFIGDIHGDLLALDSAIQFIDAKTGGNSTIIFLGDLIDRFSYGYEVLIRVLDLIIQRPGKILWIAGNHDAGLKFNTDTNKFFGGAEPAEFAEWLNTHNQYHSFAKSVIGLITQLPRAVFFPDGLLVVHGGVPGAAILPTIKDIASLGSEVAINYYEWARLVQYPRRRGKDIGWENLKAFCEIATNILGFKVQRVLRGHDHDKGNDQRHLVYEEYIDNPVLTFTTLSAWMPDEYHMNGKLATQLCVAQYKENYLPKIYSTVLPEDIIKEFHYNGIGAQ